MKQILVLVVAALSLTACGKSVSNDGDNGNLTHTPAPVTPTTPVPVPAAPANTGTVTFNFANHGEIGSSDNLYTSSIFAEALVLTIPSSPTSISFAQSPTHPAVTILVNNSYVCSYVWNGTNYAKHSSCLSGILVQSGDVMQMVNVPQGETVTVKFNYQK